jgi:uncharacterized protein (DUF2062 family)
MVQTQKRYKYIKRSLKRFYERFLRIRGRPRDVALGLALGIFIGMTPSIGIQMALAVFMAALFKWNKLSAATGVWITNPLTAPFIYSINYVIGARLLEIKRGYSLTPEVSIAGTSPMLHNAPEIFWALLLGGVILGLPLAVAGYYFCYSAITRYQEPIKETIAKQRERLAIKRKIRRKKANKKDSYSKAYQKSKP